VIAALTCALVELAGWLELDGIAMGERGDLAAALSRSLDGRVRAKAGLGAIRTVLP
jgi:hypothetical protein